MEKIVLIGAGGHAKTIVDTLERQNKFEIVGFIDKGEKGRKIYRSYQIIGNDDDMQKIFSQGVHHAFICIGYMGKSSIRELLYNKFKQIGFTFPVIIDSSAVVALDAIIKEGTYIGRRAVINADAQVGKMCIINTAAVIEHECKIGDFTHVSVGSVVCGQSRVEDHVMLGANSTIIQNVMVGENCIIGAGSVVLNDIPEKCTAVGVPAKIVKGRIL